MLRFIFVLVLLLNSVICFGAEKFSTIIIFSLYHGGVMIPYKKFNHVSDKNYYFNYTAITIFIEGKPHTFSGLPFEIIPE